MLWHKFYTQRKLFTILSPAMARTAHYVEKTNQSVILYSTMQCCAVKSAKELQHEFKFILNLFFVLHDFTCEGKS